MDKLDDDTEGLKGAATYCMRKNGSSREPMRTLVGGAVVAFLRAFLLFGRGRSGLDGSKGHARHCSCKDQSADSLVKFGW
ncbi:hypothetical protein EUGRSUZ_B01020 [Eucalyptus grandis]|uniref:Uncharacterized protein n=2 Tax=Eucalyptus grandis TaxID=71139 RepID=A0A059D097_EUCGR|nr:hypothetical protein EUGRSUZ_B01020 [Eucalyptus grandis]